MSDFLTPEKYKGGVSEMSVNFTSLACPYAWYTFNAARRSIVCSGRL